MENRNRLGFRDDDELIAVIVVLLLVAILAFYFIRGFGNRQNVVDDVEQPIAVVEDAGVELENSLNIEEGAAVDVAVAPVDTTGIAADADVTVPEIDTELVDTADTSVSAATFAPAIALATNRFRFGPVLLSGTGDPNTNLNLEISGTPAGNAQVDADGNWEYVIPAGRLGPGDHAIVAVANDLRSDPQTFTLEGPEAPALSANWDNSVTKPGQWEISGTASPNWEVAVGVAGVDAEPVRIPTDDNGNWRATVDLATPGTYELEVFAVNLDGSVNYDASTGTSRIVVTEDGQPPAVAAPAEPAADETGDVNAQAEVDAAAEQDAANAQAEADAAAQTEAEAQAAAEAEANAAAEAEAQAQAEADANAAATTEAETAAAAQAEADAAAQAEADAAAAAEAEAAEQEAAEAEAVATTIYKQLQATGQHNTLLAAVDATGLGETLEQRDQALTVFAPTDAAFGNLPAGVVDGLIANPEALRAILVEHVVAGELPSSGISAETTSVTNIADHTLAVTVSESGVNVAGSNVTQADISASNGVIHAIDQVILPPSDIAKPNIDAEGVPIFKGTFLTVVGTAQPGTSLILTINGVEFGQQIIGDEGTFQISGDITDGDYVLKAYTIDNSGSLRGISDTVRLIVDNS